MKGVGFFVRDVSHQNPYLHDNAISMAWQRAVARLDRGPDLFRWKEAR